MRSVRYASCSAATTQLHLLGHDRRVAVALVERPGRTRTRSGSPCQTRVKQSATRRGAGRTARSALHTEKSQGHEWCPGVGGFGRTRVIPFSDDGDAMRCQPGRPAKRCARRFVPSMSSICSNFLYLFDLRVR
jgi:hypothetical protein